MADAWVAADAGSVDGVEPCDGPARAAPCPAPIAAAADRRPCSFPRAAISAGSSLLCRPPQAGGRGQPPSPPETTLASVAQPSSPWATVKKPRKLRGFYHDAAAAQPAAAPPSITIVGNMA